MMLDLILPHVENKYAGPKISYQFLIVATLLSTFRSLTHILRKDGGANSIAGIDISNAGG